MFHSPMLETVEVGVKRREGESVQLRKPTEDDLQRFLQCLATDADHKAQNADAWTLPPGEFFVLYDRQGNRVWVRLERMIRVHFQHDHETPRKELVTLIYKGMSWVIGSAREKQFEEVIFASRAPRLIAFLQKLFGFAPVEGNYSVRT